MGQGHCTQSKNTIVFLIKSDRKKRKFYNHLYWFVEISDLPQLEALEDEVEEVRGHQADQDQGDHVIQVGGF